MSEPNPDNSELDAVFRRAEKHPEVRVEMLRLMLESELYTLVPRGQSMRPADSIARPEGQSVELVRWGQEGREYHFVFTSAGLARKGLRHFSAVSRQPIMIIGLPGRDLLGRISRHTVGIAINPAVAGFELTCNDKVLKDAIDGTLFEGGGEPGEHMEGTAKVLPPEDYPLALVQPVFDFLKGRPEVLAAWVLEYLDGGAEGGRCYVFALLTTTDDNERLEHEVGAVMAMVDTSERRGMEFGVTTFDYNNQEHAGLMRKFQPFYAAHDFAAPGGPEL